MRNTVILPSLCASPSTVVGVKIRNAPSPLIPYKSLFIKKVNTSTYYDDHYLYIFLSFCFFFFCMYVCVCKSKNKIHIHFCFHGCRQKIKHTNKGKRRGGDPFFPPRFVRSSVLVCLFVCLFCVIPCFPRSDTNKSKRKQKNKQQFFSFHKQFFSCLWW